MKFALTPTFAHDYARLKPEWQQQFRSHVQDFNAACDEFAATAGGYVWPARLRVSRMSSVRAAIWEMTWSFSSPDGRATFQFVEIDGDRAVLWRRIGNHAMYRDP